ncbi:hypothetical protein L6452_18515 [Arctium lappa]|uniref:Uncharacterized protein n=1 Tax=Arctium lappa TaxID=4217 RepID=A0ACB9C6E8_ARCLA|nr:hypothetical protein L6452_18515 [Arctium lappa]
MRLLRAGSGVEGDEVATLAERWQSPTSDSGRETTESDEMGRVETGYSPINVYHFCWIYLDEMRLLRAGSGVEDDEVAALAERRQSLARETAELRREKGEKKRSGDNGEVKIWRVTRERLWQSDGGVR